MIGEVARSTTRRAGPPRAVIGAIAIAWVAAIVAQVTGSAEILGHDALAEGDLPPAAAVGLFVVAWQLMVAAMMVPSSLPLIRMFRVAAVGQDDPSRATAALLAGYVAVWTAFGAAAFLGDVAVHRVVDRWGWLEANPQVISGSVLVLAGVFQFSDLKERCLRECRHPGPFLLQHYGRGAAAAFRLGRVHGLFCLGCCWALMLVGFAVGVANLWWMVALTAVMVYEKTGRHGDRAVAPVGIALIVSGALTLVSPELSPFGG